MGDRTDVRLADGTALSSSSAEAPCAQLVVDVGDHTKHLRVGRSQPRQLERERERMMSEGNCGHHSIHKMGRLREHGSSSANWTQSGSLARERNKDIASTTRVRQMHETTREVTACQAPTDVLFDEARNRPVVGLIGFTQDQSTVVSRKPKEHRCVRIAWATCWVDLSMPHRRHCR